MDEAQLTTWILIVLLIDIKPFLFVGVVIVRRIFLNICYLNNFNQCNNMLILIDL